MQSLDIKTISKESLLFVAKFLKSSHQDNVAPVFRGGIYWKSPKILGYYISLVKEKNPVSYHMVVLVRALLISEDYKWVSSLPENTHVASSPTHLNHAWYVSYTVGHSKGEETCYIGFMDLGWLTVWSGPQGCRSRCYPHSLWLNSDGKKQLA